MNPRQTVFLLTTLMLAVLICENVYSNSKIESDQWTLLRSNSISTTFNGIVAIGDRNIIAVGSYASVLHSSNGGSVWKYSTADPSGLTLSDIAKNSSSQLFAVGEQGLLTISVDSGRTWHRRAFAIKSNCRTIAFKDSLAVIAGDNGSVSVSEDDGKNWLDTSIEGSETVADACITVGRAIILACRSGNVYVSSDTGKSWSKHLVSANLSLNSICSNGNVVVVTGVGRVFQSVDNGETWVQNSSNPSFYELYDLQFRNSTLFSAAALNDLSFPHMYSNDTGKTWNIAKHTDYFNSHALCVENNNVWFAGESSSIGVIRKDDILIDTAISAQRRFGFATLLYFSTVLVDYSMVSSTQGTVAINSSDGIELSSTGSDWERVLFVPYNADSNGAKVSPSEIGLSGRKDLLVLATVQKSGGSKPIYLSTISVYETEIKKWSHPLINDTMQLSKLKLSGRFGVVRGRHPNGFCLYCSSDWGKTWIYKGVSSFPIDIGLNSVGDAIAIYDRSPFGYYETFNIDSMGSGSKMADNSYSGSRCVALFDNMNHTLLSAIRQGANYDNILATSNHGSAPYTEFTAVTNIDSSYSYLTTSKDSVCVALGRGSMLLSTDMGFTWTKYSLPFACNNVNSLKASLDRDYTIYVSASESVWKFRYKELPTEVPISEDSGFLVYPNPAKESVYIENLERQIGSSYQLLDLIGRAIMSGNVNSSKMTFNTGALEDGLYLILFKSCSGVRSAWIHVQK